MNLDDDLGCFAAVATLLFVVGLAFTAMFLEADSFEDGSAATRCLESCERVEMRVHSYKPATGSCECAP